MPVMSNAVALGADLFVRHREARTPTANFEKDPFDKFPMMGLLAV